MHKGGQQVNIPVMSCYIRLCAMGSLSREDVVVGVPATSVLVFPSVSWSSIVQRLIKLFWQAYSKIADNDM